MENEQTNSEQQTTIAQAHRRAITAWEAVIQHPDDAELSTLAHQASAGAWAMHHVYDTSVKWDRHADNLKADLDDERMSGVTIKIHKQAIIDINEPPLGCDCDECGMFVSDTLLRTDQHDRVVCYKCHNEARCEGWTKKDRDEAIKELISTNLECNGNDLDTRIDWMTNGFKGYNNMLNTELVEEMFDFGMFEDNEE